MDYLAGETNFLRQCSDLGCRRSLVQGSAWYNTWLRDIYPHDADVQAVAALCPDNKYVSPAQLAHQLKCMPKVEGLDALKALLACQVSTIRLVSWKISLQSHVRHVLTEEHSLVSVACETHSCFARQFCELPKLLAAVDAWLASQPTSLPRTAIMLSCAQKFSVVFLSSDKVWVRWDPHVADADHLLYSSTHVAANGDMMRRCMVQWNQYQPKDVGAAYLFQSHNATATQPLWPQMVSLVTGTEGMADAASISPSKPSASADDRPESGLGTETKDSVDTGDRGSAIVLT